MELSIYKILWEIVNLIYSIVYIWRWLYFRLNILWFWSYDLCLRQTTTESKESAFLQSCKKQLTKIPKHLNLIIGPDNKQITSETLSTIIKYAFIMDIKYVTFYDTRHLLNRNYQQLSLEKLSTPEGVICNRIQDQICVWTYDYSKNGKLKDFTADANGNANTNMNGSCNGKMNGNMNGSTNGASKQWFKNMEIYRIDQKDNHSQIVEVCRGLFNNRNKGDDIQKLIEKRTNLIDYINDSLFEKFHRIPDPELSLVFHRTTCTFGTLPWQTRYTEFHTYYPEKPINAITFVDYLFKYSRCEQRWGT